MGIFEKCLKTGRWPIHNDERPYHTIRYKGKVIPGNRNMKGRFGWLQIPKSLKGKRVLDIGCNAGEVSLECFNRGAEVVGVDENRDVIELASQVHAGPKYYRANIDSYPDRFSEIKKGHYDIVLCLSVVHHVNGGRMARLLKAVDWDLLIFEGHQKSFNRESSLGRWLKKHGLSWKVTYLGVSDERLSRPLWHVEKSGN